MDYSELSRETPAAQRLWLRVILRAQQEASGAYLKFGADERVIKYRAKRWLTTRSRSLMHVCYLAGFDGEKIERLIRESREKYGRCSRNDSLSARS